MRVLLAVIAVCAPLVLAAKAAPAVDVMWEGLVPEFQPLEDPFADLSSDQREDFDVLVGVRKMKEEGIISEVDPEFESGVEIAHELESQGLDIPELLARQDKFEAEVERRNQSVVSELEGRMVRIPGYALPLELSDTGVREFLLVPYVGACIHVPPPPPNQMVLVKLSDAYKFDDLFTPVWITGRMKLERSETALFHVDGEAEVTAGYTLEGVQIEPYEE